MFYTQAGTPPQYSGGFNARPLACAKVQFSHAERLCVRYKAAASMAQQRFLFAGRGPKRLVRVLFVEQEACMRRDVGTRRAIDDDHSAFMSSMI